MSVSSPAGPLTGVVITGGASGIGLATATALAEAGRPVALWDINEAGAIDAAATLAARCGVPALGLRVDLSDPQAIAPAAMATRATLPNVGGLVHAAGTAPTTHIDGVTPELWDAGLALHARALVQLVQAFRADLTAQAGGAVVAVASVNAHFGNGMIPIYTAAKGAVVSLVRALADELGRDGVRVNAISPGMIDTPILGEMRDGMLATFGPRIMLGRFGAPVEIARVIRFLLSDDASYVTAANLVVDGGLSHSQRA